MNTMIHSISDSRSFSRYSSSKHSVLRVLCLVVVLLGGLQSCSPSMRFTTLKVKESKVFASTGSQWNAPSQTSNEPTSRQNTTETYPRTSSVIEGFASYYGDEFHGRLTSSGEVFDQTLLSAAHRTLPFGTLLRVTNLRNNKSVVVKVNDRGPFVDGRVIDLSRAAAEQIDMIRQGVARVSITLIN